MTLLRSIAWLIVGALLATLAAPQAQAVDYEGVNYASLDIPQVNLLIQPSAGGAPYGLDIFGFKIFNIPGFLDTGASGVVISKFTGDLWEIPKAPGVVFSDVAIGGSTEFDVSQPVRLRIASSTALDVDNPATFETVYKQAYGPLTVQLGPTNVQSELPLDVFGMPMMIGKNVVLDTRIDIDNFQFVQTHIYDPGTPFTPETPADPGIPQTSHHIQLSYASFDRFTQTAPDGATPPTQAHNPFIGPNPLHKLEAIPPVDNTPAVEVNFNGLHAEGSFLFDTGAVSSFISTDLAAKLHVRYGPDTPDGDPQLETFDPDHPELPGTIIPNQFLLPIQGIGGEDSLAGFHLTDLLLRTLEGGLDPNDPDNIRYLNAPVLVTNITLYDPVAQQELTLDGIFGMNFLLASATVDLEEVNESPFNWVVFDEPNGLLGLDLKAVPEPTTFLLAAIGLVTLAGHAWRRRRSASR